MSPRPAIDHIRKPQILAAAAEVITERGLADDADRRRRRAGRDQRPPPSSTGSSRASELLTAALIADEERFAEELGARLDVAIERPASSSGC